MTSTTIGPKQVSARPQTREGSGRTRSVEHSADEAAYGPADEVVEHLPALGLRDMTVARQGAADSDKNELGVLASGLGIIALILKIPTVDEVSEAVKTRLVPH